MKIYVASSWRNQLQIGAAMTLRTAGLEVYDFRAPVKGEVGFRWSEIDPEWQTWSGAKYRAALEHPVARHEYLRDRDAMEWADCCVLVLPCGRSAHVEAGWMAAKGKPVWVLGVEPFEPELMYKLFNPGGVCVSLMELLAALGVKD
jgi:hypothetical protein